MSVGRHPGFAQLDSLMVAALDRCDYPNYLVEDLVASGRIKRVYELMGEIASTTSARLTVDEIASLVGRVIDEKHEEVDVPQDVEKVEEGGGSFFPAVEGSRDEVPFPAPVPVQGKRELPEALGGIDFSAIKDSVTLVRAEAVLSHWRAGRMRLDDARDRLVELMQNSSSEPTEGVAS